MDVAKLRGEIYSKFSTQKAFADSIGWPRQKLHKILTGKQVPNVTEIKQIADGLSLTNQAMFEIFLPELSRN